MSVEFRQRTPGEYGRILWRRKWMILLPTVAVALAVAYVVWRLPNVYESRTLLTVRPATISPSVVPQLPENDLSLRINNIGQEVVSRTSLEPMIVKYNLYAPERSRGAAMDALVERMRTRDLTVTLNTTRNDITNGFDIVFRAPEPKIAQAVTSELASKYVSAQTRAASNESTQTKQYFDTKLQQARDELKAIDDQRLKLMLANRNNLPSASAALVNRLSGLYDQQKTYVTEIGRMRDGITAQSNLLADTSKQREHEIQSVVQQVGDVKATLGWAELNKRKAEYESQKQALLKTFKPKHPDVIQVQSMIDSLERQMNQMVSENKERIDERRKMLEGTVDLRATTYQNNIRALRADIERQQRQLAQVEGQIAEVTQRINSVPMAEVGLSALERDYQTKKAVHDDLLEQQKKAEMISEVAANAQGESIAVIDPASLPEAPVAPNRPMLMMLGLALGLGLGLAFAAAFEVPRLLTIQSSADAEHYTGLPVLVSVPELLTAREERRLKARRYALACAAVVLTVVSVPALALFLKVTRLLEMFASRG